MGKLPRTLLTDDMYIGNRKKLISMNNCNVYFSIMWDVGMKYFRANCCHTHTRFICAEMIYFRFWKQINWKAPCCAHDSSKQMEKQWNGSALVNKLGSAFCLIPSIQLEEKKRIPTHTHTTTTKRQKQNRPNLRIYR